MDPQNQYNSLLGDTSDLHQVISVERQHLMASPGLISGIINLQLTRTTHWLSRREYVLVLSEKGDDLDDIREKPAVAAHCIFE